MDTRRLDTGQVLALGIVDRSIPATDIPDREKHHCDIDALDANVMTQALGGGKLLDLPEYYGCVYAWSDELGHHGRLLQYRNVTERPDFASVAELVEWFIETGQAVAG